MEYKYEKKEYIENKILGTLKAENTEFIIFPYGEVGKMVHDILVKKLGIKPYAIVDKRIGNVADMATSGKTILFSCENPNIRLELISYLSQNCGGCQILDVLEGFCHTNIDGKDHRVSDYIFVQDAINICRNSEIFLVGEGQRRIEVQNLLEMLGITIAGVISADFISKLKEEIDKIEGRRVLLVETEDDEWEYILNRIIQYCDSNVMVISSCAFFRGLAVHKNEMPQEMKNYYQAMCSLDEETSKIERTSKKITSLWKALNTNSVLVYQPGKVGSSSVDYSLMHSIHTHRLPKEKEYRDILRMQKHKIITLVRNPIERDISLLFQASDRWRYWAESNFGVFGVKWETDIQVYGEKAMKSIVEEKRDEFSWFDNELKAVFGVDVYQYPFDKKKGYTIIRQGNTEVLVIKLEVLDGVEDVIGEFIQEPFKLKESNVANMKRYRFIYTEFKNNLNLTKEYVEYYCYNEKTLHFYSTAEIMDTARKYGCENA